MITINLTENECATLSDILVLFMQENSLNGCEPDCENYQVLYTHTVKMWNTIIERIKTRKISPEGMEYLAQKLARKAGLEVQPPQVLE